MSQETQTISKEDVGSISKVMVEDNGAVPEEMIVKRGEKSWKFTQQKLKKKDKTAADRFALVPVKPKDPEDFQAWLDFLDPKQAALTSYQRVRGMSANWTTSSINKDTGRFIENDFIKCVEDLNARGETNKALNEERIELTNDIIALGRNTAMSGPEKIAKMTEIGERLNTISTILTERAAKAQEDEELEEATAANA